MCVCIVMAPKFSSGLLKRDGFRELGVKLNSDDMGTLLSVSIL